MSRGGGRDGGGAAILPAIITGGAAESRSKGYYGVPKRDLVAELAGMRVKVGCEGREGTHDDMVFAVALAYWAARKLYPREPAGVERLGMAAVTAREFVMRVGWYFFRAQRIGVSIRPDKTIGHQFRSAWGVC